MESYPILKKIKARLADIDKSMGWLAVQIDMSQRWIEKITTIEKINVSELLKLSDALDFDFMADYRRHLGKAMPEEVNQLSEPAAPHYQNDGITINIAITGPASRATEVLKAIQKEGEKLGFRIK